MKDEALRLALETLEAIHTQGDVACVVTPNGEIYIKPVITAVKAALEAKDEPVTENGMYRLGYHNGYGFGEAYGKANAPQRKPLTDEEIDQICGDVGYGYINVARAIEAKLKEKNT